MNFNESSGGRHTPEKRSRTDSSGYPVSAEERRRRERQHIASLTALALVIAALLVYVLSQARQAWFNIDAVPIQTLSPVGQTPAPAIPGATSVPAVSGASSVPSSPDATPTPSDRTMPSFSTSDRFWRRLLSPEAQQTYDVLKDCVAGHTQTVSFSIADRDSIARIYQDVILDYPEYFWVNGASNYLSMDMGSYFEIEFSPEYIYTVTEAQDYSRQIESVIFQPISRLSQLSDYEKVKGVYEFLIDYTIYDLSYTGGDIHQLFAEGRAVCEQYARAAQYMLNRLGLEAIYVTGDTSNSTNSDGHAWNIVKADGDYYNLDVTWGDPMLENGEQRLSYAYLCVTDADISTSHWADDAPYPKCSAIKDNYFVHEGLMLNTYDEDLLTQWLDAAGGGDGRLEFRCADAQLYGEVKSRLFDNNQIFDLMKNTSAGAAQSYTYHYYDELSVLEIELEL